ncbi:type II secretion system pilot lipoprotein GspS [Yersinia enterocolitica]|uniref:type II secretion system pilot lipoprotein GspS n=1 Tax=Yersinia enterocolitica TaxID=630 RepID=UPI003AB16640
MWPFVIVRVVPLLFLLCISGCQKTTSRSQSSQISVDTQVEQISSVIAGAKYLKYKCDRSDFPEDIVINEVAMNIAKKRGWSIPDYTLALERSDVIYQSIIQDSTSEQIKCGGFNKSLSPFSDELRMQVRR